MAKLYYRYGAMGAGKTTVVLQVIYNYEKNGFKTLLIKPEVDTKGDNKIVSRLGLERNVDILLKKEDSLLDENFENVKSIIVDESQFLTNDQVNELWYISKMLDIPVICYGIRTNFKSECFEGSKRLLEVSDEMEELVTICSCGKKAKFQARKINGNYTLEGSEVEIDGASEITYESMCGKCYIEKVLKLYKK